MCSAEPASLPTLTSDINKAFYSSHGWMCGWFCFFRIILRKAERWLRFHKKRQPVDQQLWEQHISANNYAFTWHLLWSLALDVCTQSSGQGVHLQPLTPKRGTWDISTVILLLYSISLSLFIASYHPHFQGREALFHFLNFFWGSVWLRFPVGFCFWQPLCCCEATLRLCASH